MRTSFNSRYLVGAGMTVALVSAGQGQSPSKTKIQDLSTEHRAREGLNLVVTLYGTSPILSLSVLQFSWEQAVRQALTAWNSWSLDKVQVDKEDQKNR